MSDNLEKMLKRYRGWIENDNFSAEVAAFEYLKRNPFFLEVAHLFNKEIENIRENEETTEDLTFLLDHMNRVFKRLFLYTGIDIINFHNVYTGNSTEFHNFSHGLNYNLKNAGFPMNDQHYEYSDIYFSYTSKTQGDSGKKYKKENTLDIDMVLNDKNRERWLEHLKPSLYIKINPYHSHKDLKSDLVKLLKEIKKKYPEYATPEFMINEYGEVESSFRAPTVQLKSVIALMMYDLRYIFNITSPSKQEDILKSTFDTATYYEHIAHYFVRDSYYTHDYVARFSDGNMRKIKEVTQRINGSYLKYIYPDSSAKAHLDMIKKDFYEYSEDNIDEFIEILKSQLNIKDKLEYLLLDVTRYTNEEYKKWSEELFNYSKISENEIFNIILL